MRNFGIAAIAALSVASIASASAADLPPRPAPAPPAATPSGWEFQATLPLWATAIDGTVGVGRLPSAGVHASFGDLLRHLKGVFSGAFVARNDTYIVSLDLLWSRVGADVNFKANGSGPFANLRAGSSASFTQDMTIGTAYAGYRIPIGSPDLKLYGTLGFRYQSLTAKVDLSHQFPGILTGVPVGFTLSTSKTADWVDPVIGLAMHYRFNEKWFLDGQVDIGGFGVGSKLTSQGFAAAGYNWTQSVSTSLGFKALYTDYQRNNSNSGSFRYKTTLYGPYVALNYNF